MNIRSLATAVVAAAVLVAIPSGIAVAAENAEPANCADAVSELTEADRLHDEAVAADKAVVDAEDADQALKDAKKDLKDAEEKLSAANGELAAKQAFLASLGEVGVDPDGAEGPRSAPTQAEIDNAKAAVDAAQKKVDRLTDDVKDLTEARDDAKKAADGKTRKLREEANKTDAAAALTRLDDARDDFNRLCTEGEDDPTDNNDSSVVEDNDSASNAPTVVVTPQGGVNTGGGPA